MQEHVYTNYRLVLPDSEVLGTLVVRAGAIADIQPGTVAHGQDGQGDYMLPGLVELHTDHLEQCLSPRPGVQWPLAAAAATHDRGLIAAGITTVCDAIAIGDIAPTTSSRHDQFGAMIEVIDEGQRQQRFAVDHRLHLRCELGFDKVSDIVARYADHPLLSLVSLMDHTPGQRQFAQLEKYKEYYMGKYGLTAAEMEAFIQARMADQQHVIYNRHQLVALAGARGISLASHDDATVDHVQAAVADGVDIAEFPTTLAAAREAHRHGLKILMGAPNLVLGGSHSGNVSASQLMDLDLVDIFSSDYVPQSLIQAMFLITRHSRHSLAAVAQRFTLRPARAIGLESDRGSLAVGKRADLVVVHDDGLMPRVVEVIGQGRRLA